MEVPKVTKLAVASFLHKPSKWEPWKLLYMPFLPLKSSINQPSSVRVKLQDTGKGVIWKNKNPLDCKTLFGWRNQCRVKNPLIRKIPRPPTASVIITVMGWTSAIMLLLFVFTWRELSPKLARTRLLRLSNWWMIWRWPRAIPDIWFQSRHQKISE